jgi:hypothetical protein
MTMFDSLSNAVIDVLIFIANGGLVLLYLLLDALPALLSLAAALGILVFLDLPLQARANFRPLRRVTSGYLPARAGAKGFFHLLFEPGRAHTSQVLTLATLGLWWGAQFNMASPVPWIGVGMWVLGLLVLLAIPAHQRINLLWFVKTGIAVYACLVIVSRIYLGYTGQIAPQEWARFLGSSADALQVIARTRGNVATVILWALWLIAPLGYVSLLVQQLLVNPIGLVSPLSGAQEVLQHLRQRT